MKKLDTYTRIMLTLLVIGVWGLLLRPLFSGTPAEAQIRQPQQPPVPSTLPNLTITGQLRANQLEAGQFSANQFRTVQQFSANQITATNQVAAGSFTTQGQVSAGTVAAGTMVSRGVTTDDLTVKGALRSGSVAATGAITANGSLTAHSVTSNGPIHAIGSVTIHEGQGAEGILSAHGANVHRLYLTELKKDGKNGKIIMINLGESGKLMWSAVDARLKAVGDPKPLGQTLTP